MLVITGCSDHPRGMPIETATHIARLPTKTVETPSPAPLKSPTRPLDKSIADQSFLTEKPCAAPCWYGLELNKSDENAVENALRGLPFVLPESIRKYDSTWGYDIPAKEFAYACIVPEEEDCGHIVLVDNKVKKVSAKIGYDLTLQTVIDKIGVPESVIYNESYPNWSDCLVDFIWPDRETILIYVDSKSSTICRGIKEGKTLSPNLKLFSIVYMVRDRMPHWGKPYQIPWPGFDAERQ